MADNMLEGTFSFEAGFARATSGFAHGTPMGSAYALVASGNSSSSRSHAARTRPRPPYTDRNQVTFQATKVCHCRVFSCNFLLRGVLGIPIRISLGTKGSM